MNLHPVWTLAGYIVVIWVAVVVFRAFTKPRSSGGSSTQNRMKSGQRARGNDSAGEASFAESIHGLRELEQHNKSEKQHEPQRRDEPIIAVRAAGAFFNASEKDAYRALRGALQGQPVLVFPKVRLLDLVQPKDGALYVGTLNRVRGMHVDFVVMSVPEFRPLVVLELDGWSHNSQRQQGRDAIKDEALRQAGLPILRVRSKDVSSPERVLAILGPHLPKQPEAVQA